MDNGGSGLGASTWIALGSLLVAAIAVVVTFLTTRLKVEGDQALEHTKFIREKRAALYTELLDVLVG